MDQKFKAKLYANGTAVQYPDNRNKRYNLERSENSKKTFEIRFKQRMKIYDAVTYQNYQANQDGKFNHCFITLTFRAGKVPENPNKTVSDFFDKMRKVGFKNYVWVREIGEKGLLCHYHCTTVGPRLPVFSNDKWSINGCWCETRRDYSPNGVRSGINPATGKRQLIINSLFNARLYVAKYMTKGNGQFNEDRLTGRKYAISNDLHLNPLDIDYALDFCFHPYYNSKKDIFYTQWATVGQVQPEKAMNLYLKLKNSNNGK